MRLGRQGLYKAFNEAKQFAVQFSTQMSQIQAITMKSDQEMVGERAKNISQAQELHTSISNIAETRASLYRQGLSESEVDDRTEAIIKFATVTGTKVGNATKYLTTAIQNGLVDSVESAMDVLVALGDSAATTAEEISKGMQKSAAAAANAGVSFEELSAMLTITTSRTQLGGNVAGTAMQTLLSRMTRVTNGQALIDTSGEVISANKVEAALKSVGINMREANNPQSFKDPYQILLQLSKVWNNLNDMQKGNISYAMAGGRQVNMFQALMEGFAEDNGAELERLMGLAEDSEGITDDKYALAINNINTALTDLKNTFDGIVEDLTSNGFITGA
jgi:TP901 family phage tail tape measure protein